MSRIQRIALLFVLLALGSIAGFAQAAPVPAPAPIADTGDTAWMLTSAALVLFMTIPGLFLFYGGLVRSKNVRVTSDEERMGLDLSQHSESAYVLGSDFEEVTSHGAKAATERA